MSQTTEVNRDYNLWALLHQVSDIIFSARETELQQYGIPGMQAEVLFVIKAIGKDVTPAQISRTLFRRPHSVSGILIRMEKAGLIKKTKDLKRRNLVRVALTPKGEQAYKQALKRKSIQRIISALSESEQEQLRSLLEILRNRGLKELGVEPKKVAVLEFT